jgi:hypothetical protein
MTSEIHREFRSFKGYPRNGRPMKESKLRKKPLVQGKCSSDAFQSSHEAQQSRSSVLLKHFKTLTKLPHPTMGYSDGLLQGIQRCGRTQAITRGGQRTKCGSVPEIVDLIFVHIPLQTQDQ